MTIEGSGSGRGAQATWVAAVSFAALLMSGGCSRLLAASGDGGGVDIGGAAGAGADGGMGGTAGVGGAAVCSSGASDAGRREVLGNQCDDGIDNDGDGKIDYDDPECSGPFDNDEWTFAFGTPDEFDDPCKRDCFFDDNSGVGDDGCTWQLKCDPLSTNPKCPYDVQYATLYEPACSLTASQAQRCLDFCAPKTPNGCDCFGCCVVPGVPTPVLLSGTCTAADFGDPARCPPCTQVTQCMNPCERCEVCVGKPTVPDDCRRPDGCAPYQCPGESVPCGAFGVAPSQCPSGTSCVTGCCLPG
jgi:hypothetical protein